MKKNIINRLIGYGILIFLIGFIIGFFWVKYFQLLIPIGSLMTFIGVFYFFKETDLKIEFTKNKNDDILTYFWNVIVLKLWTLIFIIWMITLNLTLLFVGLMNTPN
jgi:hypothetical protein